MRTLGRLIGNGSSYTAFTPRLSLMFQLQAVASGLNASVELTEPVRPVDHTDAWYHVRIPLSCAERLAG
jgi:hypothetical protein